jgi:hypothetical protein
MVKGRQGGRPSKLTRALTKNLIGCISDAMYYNKACDACGVSYGTFNRWMKEGEPGPDDPDYNAKYHKFREQILNAEAQLQRNVLSGIKKKATEGDRKAMEWLAEHRWKDEYGTHSTQEIKHSGSIDTQPINERIDKWKQQVIDVSKE